MSATIDTWTGRLGLAAGIFAVAAWLLIAGSPAAAPKPSASIHLGTLATGELEVSPAGGPVLRGRLVPLAELAGSSAGRPVLTSSDLAPGRPAARGSVLVRNQTPVPVDVAVRTTTIEKDLDRAARVEIRDGGEVLSRQSLGASDRWSDRTIRLSPDERRQLDVRVWIPRGAPDGWQAARADATLQMRARAVKTR